MTIARGIFPIQVQNSSSLVIHESIIGPKSLKLIIILWLTAIRENVLGTRTQPEQLEHDKLVAAIATERFSYDDRTTHTNPNGEKNYPVKWRVSRYCRS